MSLSVIVKTAVLGVVRSAPIGVPSAPMQYRWERSQSGAGWKTVMTITERSVTVGSRESRQTMSDPFAVARIEEARVGALTAVGDRMQCARRAHEFQDFLADAMHVDGERNAAEADERNA